MPCPNCVCKDCDHFFRRQETYVECTCTDYSRGDAICRKEHRPVRRDPADVSACPCGDCYAARQRKNSEKENV